VSHTNSWLSVDISKLAHQSTKHTHHKQCCYFFLLICMGALDSDLSDTDNIVPFENTTLINMLNRQCILLFFPFYFIFLLWYMTQYLNWRSYNNAVMFWGVGCTTRHFQTFVICLSVCSRSRSTVNSHLLRTMPVLKFTNYFYVTCHKSLTILK